MVDIYPCALHGCGLTENSWGFLTYSKPVTTIGEWALRLAALSKIKGPVLSLNLGSGYIQRQGGWPGWVVGWR